MQSSKPAEAVTPIDDYELELNIRHHSHVFDVQNVERVTQLDKGCTAGAEKRLRL